jgi:hypothetical protein
MLSNIYEDKKSDICKLGNIALPKVGTEKEKQSSHFLFIYIKNEWIYLVAVV